MHCISFIYKWWQYVQFVYIKEDGYNNTSIKNDYRFADMYHSLTNNETLNNRREMRTVSVYFSKLIFVNQDDHYDLLHGVMEKK